MKRNLIALAALGVAGPVLAQSSVTLFGVADATLQHVSNSGGPSVTRLTNSALSSTRIGFRGTEDLGGGMSASFWLEGGINNDNGTGSATNTNNQASGGATTPLGGGQGFTFNRRSTVSIAGSWGELRLGRDYTTQFWNMNIFDPFGSLGVGTAQMINSQITGPTALRASNSIGYFTPGNLGGFYSQLQYYLGENASGAATSKDGTGGGVRVGYEKGPMNVSAATSWTRYAAGNVRQSNIGGSYDFGVAKIMAEYERDSAGAVDATGYILGALVPVGPGMIRASYSRYKTDATAAHPATGKFALGYVHNLSKRTALYATYAQVRNTGGAANSVMPGAAGAPRANGSSSGIDLGLRHSF